MFDFNIFILFLLSISCSLTFFFLVTSHNRNSKRFKSKTPCPQSYPILGNLVALLKNLHRFQDWIADMLSETPTSTIRVNNFLNLSHGICTANPANVEHLLYSNFHNYIKGSRFRLGFHELLGDGIFAVDGQLWKLQRKIASHEFNTKSLKLFTSDTVNFQIGQCLLPYLSSAELNDQVIDLQDVLRKFSLDNILKVAFGVDPSCLVVYNDNSNSILKFVKAFDFAAEIGVLRYISPIPAIWKLKRLFNLGSEKQFKEAIAVINKFAMEIIMSREEQKEQTQLNQDLLSRFIFSESDTLVFDREQHLRRRFLRDIVISFVLAGKDSTSTALTWFFWLLAGHPHVAERIREEISSVAATAEEGKSVVVFSYEQLKKLNYLQAALSESMRLFPPVPIDTRLAVNDDVLPDGTQVRSGWFADYSAYAMGRMEKIWGSDCKDFKPERWLNEQGVFQACDQYRYPVFHGGPRICLGRGMAYVQMKSVVAAVMNEFEIEAVDGGGTAEKMTHPPFMLSMVLKMRGGLPVKLRRRFKTKSKAEKITTPSPGVQL
uniref:Cytochrome P450 oxidase CYP94F12 n=1 Tax=Polygala tenuifolia TaxID=355332 RepID=A0A3G5AR82_9FABA|nr:cytochrome P450 oxidase CYP94F12 [Polygala tenuifolia]